MAAEFITNALVSTFLETTIDNLASRFGDIFRGKKANKKQLSILKVKLLEVDVVADDAEQKQFTDPRVRDWILAAKGVVFDAEDLLDEIDFALSKSQVEALSQSTAKKQRQPQGTLRLCNTLQQRRQRTLQQWRRQCTLHGDGNALCTVTTTHSRTLQQWSFSAPKNLFKHFAYNCFTGSIREEWASMRLASMMLEANQFSGAVPPKLGKLINLQTFS